MLLRYQKMYPRLKVISNYYYAHEHLHISHWRDILNYENGRYGVVVVLDEIQNWFNSLQSKDFPPEMLTEITQQRKQSKVIIRNFSSILTCCKAYQGADLYAL